MELLKAIQQAGTTVIMATHNNALIDYFPGTVYACKDHRLESPQPVAEVAEVADEADDIPVATIENNND